MILAGKIAGKIWPNFSTIKRNLDLTKEVLLLEGSPCRGQVCLFSLLVAVIYYAILFFNTEREKQLIAEGDYMKREYERMKEQVEIVGVLSMVSKQGTARYTMIFFNPLLRHI